MLRVKVPVVDKINPQHTKFATGVENKATGDSNVKAMGRYYLTGYSFWKIAVLRRVYHLT